MSTRIRKPTIAIQAVLSTLLFGIPLIAANACSDSARDGGAPEPVGATAATGRLQLNLSARADGERVYRLKNATFTITAASSGLVQEVRPGVDDERLSIGLAPDDYDVLLHADYELELSEGAATTPVEATLVSNNPAIVAIAAGRVTPLDFLFELGGDSVETGDGGVLDLGIGVVEAGEGSPAIDCSDAHEPNDDQPLATPLEPGAALEASVCGRDKDIYRIAAPVPAGELFTLRLAFHNERFRLFAEVSDPAIPADDPFDGFITFAQGHDDFDILLASNGGEYLLGVVAVYDRFEGDGVDPDPPVDQGISYTVSLGEYVNTATNDCCTPSAVGGCSDNAVNLCMCAANPHCCSTSYDELCVTEAVFECGAQCTVVASDSDCCTPSAAPGCGVSGVEACVCDINPYCCFGEFDENCAALARARCGADCSP